MPIVTDEAVIRVRGQVDPSLQASATAAGTAYQRLAADVRMASADFNAGVISAQDYSVALQVARAEAVALRSAGVVPAGRDVVAFNTVLRTTQSAANVARQGLGTIRSSLASVTATMIGARGTLGTLAGGFLQFAAGNTIAVGVIAGLAAIALAWRKLTEETRKAREEAKKYRDEGVGVFEREILGAGFDLGRRRTALERQREAVRADLAEARRGRTFTDTRSGVTTRLPVDQAEVERLTNELRQWNRAIAGVNRQLDEFNAKVDEGRLKERDEFIREQLFRGGRIAPFNIIPINAPLTGGLRGVTPTGVTQNAPSIVGGTEDLSRANRIIGEIRQREFELLQTREQLATLLEQGKITQDEYTKALAGVEGATQRAARSTAQFAVAAINTAAALLSSAAGGGASIGGFLGLAGGLLSFVNPIAGAAVGGLGAIVSSLENRGEAAPVRLVDVSDRAAGQMARARTGPDRITVYVVDKYGNPIDRVDTLNRATQRDAVPRLLGAA